MTADGTIVMSQDGRISYLQWLNNHSAKAWQNGAWAACGIPVDAFNWKLHLASTQAESLRLLERVVPILLEAAVPFKVALDSDVLAGLNEGVFGATQVGKFVTIYPAMPDDGLGLARRLAAVTQGFSGPRIVTDLHIGGVVYARYGSHSPRFSRDRLGNLVASDDHGNGGYEVPFVAPREIENPYQGYMANADAPSRGHAPLGPGYLLLQPLSVHAKGAVFLALDGRHRGVMRTVVVKEGRRHCMSDSFGRDIRDRLRHQENVHKQLAGRVPVPAADDSFEFEENFYLPLEYVEGRDLTSRRAVPFASLGEHERREWIGWFRKLAGSLRDLHGCGCVHRDLSPRNVRLASDGRVFLLDLEISYRLDEVGVPPFQQGTMGFVSPEQLAGESPSFADDIYSFGCLLVYVTTGLDPRRIDLATRATLHARIAQLSGAHRGLVDLCARCLDSEPAERPSLAEIDSTLVTLEASGAAAVLATERKQFAAPAEVGPVVSEALAWMLGTCPRDEVSQLWLSPELSGSTHESSLQSPHAYRLFRSASRGVAGVVYVIARAHRLGFRHPDAARQVGNAVDWLLAHAPTHDDQMPGLHFGEAGVAVSIAEAVRANLIDSGPWLSGYLREALSGSLDWPDLTHGAAGQGIASLLCADALDAPSLGEHAHRCAAYLIGTQASNGAWALPAGVRSLEGVVYTGLAHGVAGIVAFLAAYGHTFAADTARDAALKGGSWLKAQMRRDAEGGVFWPMRADSDEVWKWWCHGSPGISVAFLELYRASGNQEFARIAIDALSVHPRAVRHVNLSQCHGLAGYGEALLSAHSILGDQDLLERASHVAADVLAMRHQSAGTASWLVENPYRATADLMIGCGGIVHFLARVARYGNVPIGMPLALL